MTRGFVVLVDDEDYERVAALKWYPFIRSRRTYATTSVLKPGGKSSSISMHRFILGITDRKVWVDHKDHNGLNNQKENLRTCSASQNIGNSRKTTRPTSSRFKGVCWDTQHSKWYAGLNVEGQHLYLGLFTQEEAAARAYDSAARTHFGEFALTNF